jgi:hypothetical protein
MDIERLKKIEDEDLTILENEESKDFIKKIKANRKKSAKAIKVFAKNLGTEAKETGKASKILMKFLVNGKVTEEEEKELKIQVYDLFKIAGIGIPFFMIPGASLLLPFLLKISSKYGINILPTSFDDTKDEEEE